MSPSNDIASLPVGVDAMGGDHGSSVVVEGAVHAARTLGIASILVGNESELRLHLKRLGAEGERLLDVVHAAESVDMEDSPSAAIRKKPQSSIRKTFELAKAGTVSSVVSPGNTGAMMAAGVLVSGTLPGIARPAIASLIPKMGDAPPAVLLDSGANIDCHAYQLVQFALMGKYYACIALNLSEPRIALLSNGHESSKGTDIIRAAAQSLSEIQKVNFVGYIEARDIPKNKADVVVADGFVGNVLLKAMEGTVDLVSDSVKRVVETSLSAKIGLWLARPRLHALFREKLDPSAYGGAPLLGLNHVGIVCHGSSTARAIMNGIRVAQHLVNQHLVSRVEESLTSLDLRIPGVYEDGVWPRVGERFEKGRRRKNSGALQQQREDNE